MDCEVKMAAHMAGDTFAGRSLIYCNNNYAHAMRKLNRFAMCICFVLVRTLSISLCV